MSKHTPKKYFDKQGCLIVKPYRISDLVNIYDVDRRTMRKWLEGCKELIGTKKGHYYSVEQVSLIIQKLGQPRIVIQGLH